MFDKSCRIRGFDNDLADAIDAELKRQQEHVELIASENYASPRVMEAQGSVMTNKYAEGYPGKRYYAGCEFVDLAEELARERAKELFGANFANVQPHSGSQANAAVYLALLNPGDTILGMSLNEGGHLTHGSPVNFSGKLFNAVQYGIDTDTGMIDYGMIATLAAEHRPRMLIGGFSAYSRRVDWARMREIADSVGAWFLVDMAHIAGLVAAGVYPNPLPHAHVVTSTTHKTLRGPRGGIILSNEDEAFQKKLNSLVFPGTQGGPLMHVIAAKAVAFKEALSAPFRAYQQQIVTNAATLAELIRDKGVRLPYLERQLRGQSEGERVVAEAIEQFDRVVELLLGAQSPVMIAGQGIRSSQAFDEVEELAGLIGIPVATSLKGKGVVAEARDAACRAEQAIDGIAREGRKYGLNLLMVGQWPQPGPLFVYWLISLAVCWLGYAWFQKTRGGFADVL